MDRLAVQDGGSERQQEGRSGAVHEALMEKEALRPPGKQQFLECLRFFLERVGSKSFKSTSISFSERGISSRNFVVLRQV